MRPIDFLKQENDDIENIVRRSHPAQCGVFEREVVAKRGQGKQTLQKLRKAGFKIVGTSLDEPKKIWFIRRGLAF